MLETLKKNNPKIPIYSINDEEFREFGLVIENDCISELTQYLNEHTPIPEKTVYIASDKVAEKLDVFSFLKSNYFGEMDIQIGWCNGNNRELNALEYHFGVEINVAATPAILLLGTQSRMNTTPRTTYNTNNVVGFYMEAGEVAMLYSSTLHFAPCNANNSGFRMGIILSLGTNTPLDEKPQNPMLRMKNKWLLAHENAKHLVTDGAYVGLEGDFIEIEVAQ